MKNSYKLILGLGVLLLLGGLMWRLKTPAPLRTILVHANGMPPSTPARGATPKPSQPTPIAAVPSQSNATPGGNTAPQRKFVDMPDSECRAVIREIKKKDFDSIMKAWLNAGRVEDDPIKQTTIGTVWGWEMEQRPVPLELYKKMKAIMDDPSYSATERGGMIGILSLAMTPEAAKILIDEATTQADAEVKRMATSALGELGNNNNEAIAALLEPLWKESNDPLMLRSVAKAIGSIGKASSVEMLFNAALAGYGDLHDERASAAGDGLRLAYTENAIPPLAAALEKNPPGSRASQLALDTLAHIVNPAPNGGASPQTVIKWLQTADSSAAPSAKEWVGKSQQIKAAQAALDPSVPFHSEANRQALRAGLDAYRAGHKLEP